MTQSIADFIAAHGITLDALKAGSNPFLAVEDDAWASSADHWACTLRRGEAAMIVHYSMGAACAGRPPTAAEVLGAVALDAGWIDVASGFEDWCETYGYDGDSRRAERTFNACKGIAKSLKALLGEEAYDALLWRTEKG